MVEGSESVQPEEAQLHRLGSYFRFIVLVMFLSEG